LGLLGPAALTDDDSDRPTGFAGIWNRVGPAPAAPAVGEALRLGAELEVIPVDDRLILDDGSSEDASWTVGPTGTATQVVVVDGNRVTRELTQAGQTLKVRTTVHAGEQPMVLLDCYTRSV
jgi:hypothetical protein